MKLKNIILSLSVHMLLLFSAISINAQSQKLDSGKSSASKIEVIQFHSEHRCMTCNNIETLTKETLKKNYPSIKFSLVNVDDAMNAKKAEKFEAAGTALFLYNPITGKKKDLTDFAFMNAGNKEKFKEGLKKEIKLFSN